MIHLAVDVADILAAWHTTTDPARLRHLLHKVVRVLDILLEQRDLRRILLVEELLRHGAALLAQANLLGMQQTALHIRVAPTISHERHRHVRPRLCADITLMAVVDRLVPEKRIGVDARVIDTVALARVNGELVDGHRIHAGCLGHQVGRHIVTGADALGVEGLQAARIVAGVRKSIKGEAVCHSDVSLQK